MTFAKSKYLLSESETFPCFGIGYVGGGMNRFVLYMCVCVSVCICVFVWMACCGRLSRLTAFF